MKRLIIGVALFGSALVLSSGSAPAQDKIYHGAKDNKPAEGKITADTPAGITYTPKGGKPATMTIPASQIIQVDYGVKDNEKYGTLEWNGANNALRQARDAAKASDRAKAVEKALDKLRMLAPLVADNKALSRSVQFGIAEVLAIQTEDDSKQIDAAIDALKKFKTNFGDGWQLVKATKMLVRLLEQKGDEGGAQAAYTELADNEAAPKEVRQEFGMLVVRYLLRKGKHADAATRIKALDPVIAANDPLKVQLKVYLAACDIAARNFSGVEDNL